MTGPSTTQAETVLNAKLGELLIARHPRWNEHNVFIDSTRVLRDHEAEKIDVLVVSDGGQPVAVEAKFKRNASQLRQQVEEHLGKVVKINSLPIETGCVRGVSGRSYGRGTGAIFSSVCGASGSDRRHGVALARTRRRVAVGYGGRLGGHR